MENLPGADVKPIDKEIFECHNHIRQDPKWIIPDLEAMLKQFDGMLLKREGKVTLRTKEGAEAVQEAIDFLKKCTPM
jgi:hypothetical protein